MTEITIIFCGNTYYNTTIKHINSLTKFHNISIFSLSSNMSGIHNTKIVSVDILLNEYCWSGTKQARTLINKQKQNVKLS